METETEATRERVGAVRLSSEEPNAGFTPFGGRKTRGGGLEGLVRAPLVLDELSTGAVLTMEWIDGARLTDVARLATAGVTPAALVSLIRHARSAKWEDKRRGGGGGAVEGVRASDPT